MVRRYIYDSWIIPKINSSLYLQHKISSFFFVFKKSIIKWYKVEGLQIYRDFSPSESDPILYNIFLCHTNTHKKKQKKNTISWAVQNTP